MRCSAALRPPRAFFRLTTVALICSASWLMSEAFTAVIGRSPHAWITRFQYEPYTRRVPALTAAETRGMYSANVGTPADSAGAWRRSAGVTPSFSSSTRAASISAGRGWSVMRVPIW